MDQYEQIQIYNKKFFLGIAMKIALVLSAIIGAAAVTWLMWYYEDLDDRKIKYNDAKKIGNWELPDDYYVYQSAFQLKMFSDVAKNVEILDEKSGNEINILEMSKEFSDAHLKFDATKEEDEKSNDELFMDFYAADNYAIRSQGKIKNGNSEVNYNLIGDKEYENLNDKISGFLGEMDCDSGVIIVLVTNTSGRYDNARALEFAKKLSCGSSDTIGEPEKESGDIVSDAAENISNNISDNSEKVILADDPIANNHNKVSDDAYIGEENTIEADRGRNKTNPTDDSDSDGLSNEVESLISSDPNNADTDSDGFSDFDEIKYGYNPQVPSPGDELPPNYYRKLKEDIKNINEESYNKIFGNN